MAQPSIDTQLYINGKWCEASDGHRFDVLDPATEQVLASVADGSPADALAAVEAAGDALPAWAARAPRERAEVLRQAFTLFGAQKEQFAQLMTRENGKALSDSRGEASYAAEFFRWYSEEAVRNIGQISKAPSSGARILVQHKPAGVAVLITPWNFPAAMGTRKIAPALAAGCTVVVKPASETPLTMLALARLLEQAGVPAGVVNVLPSRRSSAVVGAMLTDPRVRVVSFTGSTATGRALLGEAARFVINPRMELGGNAPFIVFEDADLEAAVAGAMIAKMRNMSESRHRWQAASGPRILLPTHRADGSGGRFSLPERRNLRSGRSHTAIPDRGRGHRAGQSHRVWPGGLHLHARAEPRPARQ